MRNPIFVQVDVCNSSDAKCMVLQSQTSRSRPENHQKKKPNEFHIFCCVNPPKIDKNPSLDLKVFFLVLPDVPGSSQGRPGHQSGGIKHGR